MHLITTSTQKNSQRYCRLATERSVRGRPIFTTAQHFTHSDNVVVNITGYCVQVVKASGGFGRT
jgi:hypothetical protein